MLATDHLSIEPPASGNLSAIDLYLVATEILSAGAVVLDFSGHSVEDSFLLRTLPAFSQLRVLSLNTSRKLSLHFVVSLTGAQGPGKHLTTCAGLQTPFS